MPISNHERVGKALELGALRRARETDAQGLLLQRPVPFWPEIVRLSGEDRDVKGAQKSFFETGEN